MSDFPCKNPSCKSFGRPHPNCRCAPMAEGGIVKPYCSTTMKHLPSCEYYAEGGEAHHPDVAAHHVAISKGLSGLLNNVGASTMQEPEKYHKVIAEAKESYANRQQNPESPTPRTMASKLGHHLAQNDYDEAGEAINGHPLAGLVGKTHLKAAIQHLGQPLIDNESNPAAFRGSVDYLSNAIRGGDTLTKHIDKLLDAKSKIMPDQDSIESLKDSVSDLANNPSKMLDIGGNLNHYLPDHGVQLAATAASAVTYLNSIKPLNIQASPLDPILPPSESAMGAYDRQVSLAQNPLMLLQHAKTGMLLPSDIVTIQTIYPKLYSSMVSKIGQQMIDKQAEGRQIPYKMRSSLGMLLGQPLDSTMSTRSMQAIKAVNGPVVNQPPPAKHKAPATTLKAEEKANKMTETPLQARQIDRKA
jgi:hypothetical protein